MMNSLGIWILLASFLLIFTTCKKKNVVEVNPRFIGSWKSCKKHCYNRITINEDGSGTYAEVGTHDECFGASISGNFKMRKDKLKLEGYTFRIIQEPTYIDSLNTECGMYYDTWQMELRDPLVYSGDNHTYYKEQ